MILETFPRGQRQLRCSACGGTLATLTPHGVFTRSGRPLLATLTSRPLLHIGGAEVNLRGSPGSGCGQPSLWLEISLPSPRPGGPFLAQHGEHGWLVFRQHGRATHLFGPAPVMPVIPFRHPQAATLAWAHGLLRDLGPVVTAHEGPEVAHDLDLAGVTP